MLTVSFLPEIFAASTQELTSLPKSGFLPVSRTKQTHCESGPLYQLFPLSEALLLLPSMSGSLFLDPQPLQRERCASKLAWVPVLSHPALFDSISLASPSSFIVG